MAVSAYYAVNDCRSLTILMRNSSITTTQYAHVHAHVSESTSNLNLFALITTKKVIQFKILANL